MGTSLLALAGPGGGARVSWYTTTASAQTVIVTKAPAGSTVEFVLNATTVGIRARPMRAATITLAAKPAIDTPDMDAQIYVDVCDNLRRVLIVDRSRAARAGGRLRARADRRSLSGPPDQHARDQRRRGPLPRCCCGRGGSPLGAHSAGPQSVTDGLRRFRRRRDRVASRSDRSGLRRR